MSETTARITQVWIEEGCISCSLCSDLVPDVFLVENGESCLIKPAAGEHFDAHADAIREAVQDCPVEVIKFEELDG